MFYQPAAGQLSKIGRNFFRLPHNFNIDMTVGKKIAITERQTLQLRLEIQNLTNSVVYDTPYNSNITNGSFAYMLGQTFNTARKMQVSAKYEF